MNIYHLTFSKKGGAGVAASNLNQALNARGIDSKLIFNFESSVYDAPFRDPKLTVLSAIDNFLIKRDPTKFFSIARNYIHYLDDYPLEADSILHLHWIPGLTNFNHLYPLKDMKFVITLHDAWFFTGGCHFPGTCGGYETGCSNCPSVHKIFHHAVESELFKKTFFLNNDSIKFICPSEWLATKAQKSLLLKDKSISIIPNIVNTNIYPVSRNVSRKSLKIPADEIVFGVVALNLSEKRKNIIEAKIIVEKIALNYQNNFTLLLVGNKCSKYLTFSHVKNLKIKNISFQQVSSDLNYAYNSMDFFINPSLEDNYPNTLAEARSVGLKIIYRNSGGSKEVVDGYEFSYEYDNLDQAISLVNKILSSSNSILHNDTRSHLNTNTNSIESHLKIYETLK
jgi:glycosyltransferase involved in cell wall biosynthesis